MDATTTRQARCACGRTAPSDSPYLAFFEDRSAPKVGECAHCGYTDIAHERFAGRLRDVVAAGTWPRGVTPHDFEQRVEGREFDSYYCGHGGWE